ncbi:hypothetical protein [Thiobacillus denitrificans]|jgi:hypothetical protein|uniref:hypothetical protein n=1 Tax=Thiobacillus denitrificans TaxID=36861 RepID=UPI0003770C3C|nr:hypothetical protein [Thiobacillus denitrificans]
MNVFRVAVRIVAAGSVLLGIAGPAYAAENAAGAALTTDAAQALSNAVFVVDLAKGKGALWTTAAGALTQAQEAAKKQDSAAVIKHAAAASEQAFLGMAQLGYPLTVDH